MAKKKMRKAKKRHVPAASHFVSTSQTLAEQVSSIVAQVLVHFGAGYMAERQTEAGAANPPANMQIFQKLSDFNGFHFLLTESTARRFAELNWATNQPLRDQVFDAAFEHGARCRRAVVADGTVTLKLKQILIELEWIQANMCPGGPGGGPICDF